MVFIFIFKAYFYFALANEITNSHEGEGVEDLKNEISIVSHQWAELSNGISQKHTFLQDANLQYGELRGNLGLTLLSQVVSGLAVRHANI